MRIKIRTKDCRLTLALPSRMLFSGFTANLICRGINRSNILHKSYRTKQSESLDSLAAEAAREEAVLELEEGFPEDGFIEGAEDADEDGDTGDYRLSPAQMCVLFKALRECRKTHPGLVLVDVCSKDGDIVKITL